MEMQANHFSRTAFSRRSTCCPEGTSQVPRLRSPSPWKRLRLPLNIDPGTPVPPRLLSPALPIFRIHLKPRAELSHRPRRQISSVTQAADELPSVIPCSCNLAGAGLDEFMALFLVNLSCSLSAERFV